MLCWAYYSIWIIETSFALDQGFLVWGLKDFLAATAFLRGVSALDDFDAFICRVVDDGFE